MYMKCDAFLGWYFPTQDYEGFLRLVKCSITLGRIWNTDEDLDVKGTKSFDFKSLKHLLALSAHVALKNIANSLLL